MLLFGEIGLGTQYELPKSVKSYRIWASGRGENRKMLKINELNSYLKNKGEPKNIVAKMNIWQFYILSIAYQKC